MRPLPPRLNPGYVAVVVLVSFILLALPIVTLIVLMVCLCRRRTRRRRKGLEGSPEHVYEALGIVPQVTRSEIVVLPNEAYRAGRPPTPSPSYGSTKLNIRETYNNLAITLNPQ